MVIGMPQSVGHIGTKIGPLSYCRAGPTSYVSRARILLTLDTADSLLTQIRDKP